MDHLVNARNLVAELAREEQLEARRPDAVGRDLAQWIGELGRPPSGRELEEWLGQHRLVTELYAGAAKLDELLLRHFDVALAPTEPVREAHHPDLERQIAQSPESVDVYLVYSDWLQERSDPLGELIALGVAATAGGPAEIARFERHLKQHEERFLGGVGRHVPDRVALHWRYGLVRAIDAVDQLDARTWEELLRLRVCSQLTSIMIHRGWTGENTGRLIESTVEATISAYAARSLRALTLEGCDGRELPTTLLRRSIEELTLVGDRVSIGPDSLPASLVRLRLDVPQLFKATNEQGILQWDLRELRVQLTARTTPFLVQVELPRLERLELDLCGAPADSVPELLQAVALPSLIHLEVCDGRIDPLAFRAIAQLPIAARISSLALTGLELTDEAMQALAVAHAPFASLTSVDVSNNELSREGLAAAREIAPDVVSRRQEKPGTAAHRRLRRFAGSRLQVAEEIVDPRSWQQCGVDGDVLWARYAGNADYELFVTRDLRRYGCSCPSSIQPCKHVVALALLAERGELAEAPSGGIENRLGRAQITVRVDADDVTDV
jgi:uncharacterized protein (TIGR02996 family)